MNFRPVSRRFAITILLASACSLAASEPAKPSIQFMPLEAVKPGMRGVAYTVFQGVRPQPMDVEVLGVMKGVNGPRQDLILIRLHGSAAEYTGVVAGMSGSPVYVDGKLVGAIAYRIGEFSKEPIAGVTPIGEMLEINELDRTQPAGGATPEAARSGSATKTSGPGMAEGLDSRQLIKPIDTPLVFTGFTPETLRSFAPQFAAAGIVPVAGAGSVSDDKQPEPLEPGSAVSMSLVEGDVNIAATCTVTYMDAEHLLACGHPVLQFGAVHMPMRKAQVVATLASPMNSFKIVNTTETVGAFVQDRHSGILGKFDAKPEMIPVTVSVHGGSQPREYHFRVLSNPRLTPLAVASSVFSSLQGTNEFSAEATYRVQGKIHVDGYPDVAVQNMFAPTENGPAPAFSAALMPGERFTRIFGNPVAQPQIMGLDLEVSLTNERRAARLETARTAVTEARPGDEIQVEAVLRPYRGERIVRRLAIKVPTSANRGPLRILVSDGDTLDRMRRVNDASALRLDLGSTIALLNKQHANNQLYVSMLEPHPQAIIEDKVMPAMPASIMNVMDGMRGTQDMTVTGESSVSEASVPLDYVVSGSQIISVDIK